MFFLYFSVCSVHDVVHHVLFLSSERTGVMVLHLVLLVRVFTMRRGQ